MYKTSPIAQLVKNPLQCRRPQFDSWVGKIHWRRDRLPIPVFLGFPVVQLVKDPPAMWETCVRSLGWEDPLEKGVYPLQYAGLENSTNCIVHGVAKSWTPLSNFHFTTLEYKCKILEWDRWGSCRSVELWLRTLSKCPLPCSGTSLPSGQCLFRVMRDMREEFFLELLDLRPLHACLPLGKSFITEMTTHSSLCLLFWRKY